ncbi:bifunctional phosphopantothenoylcysteine decarboxylase/phosphopantothenate--cysteine ligase CoaBC, partial [bacterium]|nr:bifunctional phosphopantothenoylcysteine decarboxylase/phosphopantothenate--cysteine ligase CoaBC [bacterium]
MSGRFQKKKILLGVTGSIAAYKACELLRLLIREGADVRVSMTRSAQKFVSSLTFETLSGHDVIIDLFPDRKTVITRHIHIAEWADCILICPATANIIGKTASGIADDFLSTTLLAARSPVIFAPAMDYQMVNNPIYQENVKKLENLGYLFISTEEGELASGARGYGRLAILDRIFDAVKSVLLGTDTLKDIRVLISAGPTQEFLDPVRYLTNSSSGRMGYSIAEEAKLRGAEVTLVSGPTNLRCIDGINLIDVKSAEDMSRAIIGEWEHNQVLIMSAAVADYKPNQRFDQKIKKGESEFQLTLKMTDDILSAAAANKKGRVVVGFAMETEKGVEYAKKKCIEKKCDFICLNNPMEEGSGFGEDTNKITLIDNKGDVEYLPLMSKLEVAQKILDRVEIFLKQ